MCNECELEMPEREQILQWLQAYPVPSEQRAGIAGRIGRMVKEELLTAWGREESFDVQQAMFDLQRVQCVVQGLQMTLQPLQQMKMQIQQAQMRRNANPVGILR